MLVTCCALFAAYDFLTRRRTTALMERGAELRAQSALAKNRHTFLSMVSHEGAPRRPHRPHPLPALAWWSLPAADAPTKEAGS